MKVLVLVHDAELRADMVRHLRRGGFAIDVARSRQHARVDSTVNEYACLIVEHDDPATAIALVVEHRDGAHDIPLLLVTHEDDTDLRVRALHTGADAVLTTPFAMPELVARVNALGRRRSPERPGMLQVGDLVVDRARHEVRYRDRTIPMSPRQHAVLECLAAARGRVVSRGELLRRCWDEQAEYPSNVLEQQIRRLRSSLGDRSVIETVRGTGYRLALDGRVDEPEPDSDG